jgi:PIN domain nuclease of toxin-antitoxin system
MRLLLDAHALIWYVDQDHLLSQAAHAAMTDSANELLLSAGTVWEIGIKVGLKKLTLSMPYCNWMNRAIADLGLVLLPIHVEYVGVQVELPRHHADPFDRMLASQAIAENIPIVSADAIFDQYGVKRIWDR